MSLTPVNSCMSKVTFESPAPVSAGYMALHDCSFNLQISGSTSDIQSMKGKYLLIVNLSKINVTR